MVLTVRNPRPEIHPKRKENSIKLILLGGFIYLVLGAISLGAFLGLIYAIVWVIKKAWGA